MVSVNTIKKKTCSEYDLMLKLIAQFVNKVDLTQYIELNFESNINSKLFSLLKILQRFVSLI